MKAPPRIFNKRLLRLRRERSAAAFSAHDFLHRRAMEDIVDRLETVTRDFPKALFIGAGEMTGMLTEACGVGDVFHMDASVKRLPGAPLAFVADDEALPVATESLDLIVNLLTLHHANDLVGALAQARASLKPDGLFIAAIFGEDTLRTFRMALQAAEAELTGGLSPRFSPLAVIQDFGQALTRAGFALPAVDIDKVSVDYQRPDRLLKDLRGMGETNPLIGKAAPLRRAVVARGLELFEETGGRERFDIVFLTGWAPHASQPKPLKPGAGKASLEDAVKKGMN